MKMRNLLVVTAAAGAVAAWLKKRQELDAATPQGIWKPVDPLRPYGDRPAAADSAPRGEEDGEDS